MASSRSTNTMQEGLNGLLSSISEMKTMPDADLNFLIQLETTILQKIREPYDQMSGQMSAPTPGGQPMPPPPGAMPGGMPGGGGPGGFPMGQGGGARGMRTEPAAPNPDELRRMLGQ